MLDRVRKLSVILTFFISCDATAHAQDSVTRPLAIVDGVSISAQEVESAAAEALTQLEFRRIQFEIEMKRERESVLENALDRILTSRVLAVEAAKRRITIEELLEIEVNSAAPLPSDEAVVQFYNTNRAAFEGSLGDHAASIRNYLRDGHRQEALDKFVKDLKKSYHAVSLAEPLRTTIPLEGRPSKGPADAPVTLVEFSDFECPYCRALFPTLQQITEEYKHKVRIVYLQFPLADMHPHALKAAEASLCAFEQGKFWQMHDAMFTDQTHLQVQDLKRKALELSLDMDLFIACLDSGKQFARVRSDVGEGVKAGVSGTPALFINGRILIGNQPAGEIRRVIEDELRRASVE